MSRKEKYEKELIEAIKKHKIAFFDHAFPFVSFSSSTAYNHELEKLESIRDLISNNRHKAKNYMLNKWIGSDNPTLQIAAMRLLSTSEEHQKLNQTYIDHTTRGEKLDQGISVEEVDLKKLTPEQIELLKVMAADAVKKRIAPGMEKQDDEKNQTPKEE